MDRDNPDAIVTTEQPSEPAVSSPASGKLRLFASTFACRAIGLASTVVLGRLLTPTDYGCYSLLVYITGLVASLGDFGVYKFVTARRDIDERRAFASAAIIAFFVSFVSGVVATVAAVWLYWVYDEWRMLAVGLIITVTQFVAQYYNLQITILARGLQFSRWAGLEILIAIVTTAAAILLAIMDTGMFALALPALLAPLVACLIAGRGAALPNPRHASWATLSEMIHFGWRNAVFQYVNNVQINIAGASVGTLNGPRIHGPEARAEVAGIFSRGTNVCNLFGHSLVLAIDRVLYPLMCHARDDAHRFASLFVRGCTYLMALSGFGAAIFVALSPDLIRVMLGEQWSEVPPLLQILSLGLFLVPFGVPAIHVATIKNRLLTAAGFSALQLALLPIAIIGYRQWGIEAFCGLWVASQWVVVPLFFWWACRQLSLSMWIVLPKIIPILVIIAGVALAMWGVRRWLLMYEDLTELLGAIIRLAACIPVGVMIFTVGLWALDRTTFMELRNLVRPRRSHVPTPLMPGTSHEIA